MSYEFEQEDSFDLDIATILERATSKMKEEVGPLDQLLHEKAILEQRVRLTDEALKKLAVQQLRTGIEDVPREDLHRLLLLSGKEGDFDSIETKVLRNLVKEYLANL